MPFVSVPGIMGKIYVPEKTRKRIKKHPCRDCFSCQQCSDDRCRVCLSSRLDCCNNKIKINEDDPALLKSVAPCNCGVME